GAWAGVRPTNRKSCQLEERPARDKENRDHEQDRPPGLFSIVGGKLASFRIMSEEAVDLVCKKIGKGTACTTHREPLPGGERAAAEAEFLAREHEVPDFAAARLSYRHGAEAEAVLRLCAERPALRAQAC